MWERGQIEWSKKNGNARDLRCMQECGRRSNMVRHIDRIHAGLGNPVKENPFATGSSIRNIHGKSDPPSSSGKLRPNAFQAKDDFFDMSMIGSARSKK